MKVIKSSYQFSNQSVYALIIYALGLKNQFLLSRAIDLGLIQEIRQLKQIDKELMNLLEFKATGFNFVDQVSKGRTLLVGEGNFSFALNLAQMKQIFPGNLTATTDESQADLSPSAMENVKQLKYLGASIIFNVDAINLASTFGLRRFDNIIFQFPNTGSRDSVNGYTANFALVQDFLISAASQLNPNGQVLISAVDSSYYRGAFNFDEAASLAGFKAPVMYTFDPSEFLGYQHTMTLSDESAIHDYDKFGTWVFKLN